MGWDIGIFRKPIPPRNSAAGALVDYVARTQKGKMPHIARLRQLSFGDVMDIDPPHGAVLN